jgi:hypothetical protein
MRVKLPQEEKRVKRIGGKFEGDYLTFRDSVAFINENYIPLFYLLGFNHPEDKDIIIDCLLSGESIAYSAKKAYIEKGMERVASGKLSLEKLLTKRLLIKEYPTPEEREKRLKTAAHKALTFRYKKLKEIWEKEYEPPLYNSFAKLPLQICREALFLSEEGLIINLDKFIETYTDHLKASGSKRGKLHQEAADAINRFFNGVEITYKEMERYFILSNGVIKPNPNSMNTESYLRLGHL